MNAINGSLITKIRLLGFQLPQNLAFLVFSFLLLIFGAIIFGNVLIITLVNYSKSLHSPMYFFLTHLSLLDILLVIDVFPSIFHTVMAKETIISLSACIIQFYFFGFPEVSECLLLTVMSYDRYSAICKPLHYSLIMTNQVCWIMVIGSWTFSLVIIMSDILIISVLDYCGPNIIDHFFCDLDPILELSCTDTTMVQLEVKLTGTVVVVFPFCIIIVSYIYITATIFEIPSVTGRKKVFSTCSSHLTVVAIFYGTLACVYLVPHRGKMRFIAKFLSLLYTVVTPMMNPIIYSLRNEDLKKAVGRHISNSWKTCFRIY